MAKFEDFELEARRLVYEELFLPIFPYDTSFVYRSDFGKVLFLALGLVREMLDFYVLTALSIKYSRLKNESINVHLCFVNDLHNGEIEILINFGSFHYDPSISTVEVVDTIKAIIHIHEQKIKTSPYSSIKTPGLMVVFKK